ncbi:MAG: hypothetical protein ABR585_10530 [Gemmatimonadaceae bacterium]
MIARSDSLEHVTPAQRSAIRQICATREIRSLPPEHFVVGLKAALVSVVDEVGIRPGPSRNEFIGRLMTVGIEQFYEMSAAAERVQKADGECRGVHDAFI